MRLISFSLTTPQFRDGSKTVTRRVGWQSLKAGDRLLAVEKAMGLRKGEHPVPLGVIEVVSVRREHIREMDPADCAREGFPDMTPADFAAMFTRHMKCPDGMVTRIEFKRVEAPQ